MKANLEIKEKDINLEFKNLTIDKYRMVGRKPNEFGYLDVYPIGEEITFMTSNMPDPLYEAIKEMVSQYCNH